MEVLEQPFSRQRQQLLGAIVTPFAVEGTTVRLAVRINGDALRVSQLLIQHYLNDLQTLRRASGTSRESVVREAFKTLLKDWGKSRDSFRNMSTSRLAKTVV
jgi:hypothetical protein